MNTKRSEGDLQMLSEKEKLQMLEMARSEAIREEFRNCSRNEYIKIEKDADLNRYLEFLTVFSKIFSEQKKQSLQSKKPHKYFKVLL